MAINSSFLSIFIFFIVTSVLDNFWLYNSWQAEKEISVSLLEEIKQHQENQAHLNRTIHRLEISTRQAQQNNDELQQLAHTSSLKLQNKIQSLEKELASEICTNEPVNYPADWVHSY